MARIEALCFCCRVMSLVTAVVSMVVRACSPKVKAVCIFELALCYRRHERALSSPMGHSNGTRSPSPLARVNDDLWERR